MDKLKHRRGRLLIIEPPFYRLYDNSYSISKYPHALGYLAGAVKQHMNWDVVAYNADFFPNGKSTKLSHLVGKGFDNYLRCLKDRSASIWNEIRSNIEEYNPDVIGISVKSQSFTSGRIVAKIAKEIDQNIVVIVGGPHPSMVGADVLKCPDIDIAVRGEGEKTLLELLCSIDDKSGYDDIKGIVYRRESQIVENAPREFIKDLDSLCYPHQSASEVLMDYSNYPLSAFRSIFATRGCPFNCFFCGSKNIWGRVPRYRSADNVIGEIKSLEKMGVKFIHFDDDTFGINVQYLNELCNAIIRHCPNTKWSCEFHVKLVDDATIKLMKRAGCYSIQLGIESGNNDILKKIRKGITIEEALNACRIIKKYDIELNTFFMVGFPHDTEQTLTDTINAMNDSESDSFIYSIFTPYPGTEAYDLCNKEGLIKGDFDVSLYNHQSPKNSFCLNINNKLLRYLCENVEKMIDKKNSLLRIKKLLSLDTVDKIREIGFGRSIKKGLQILSDYFIST